jgi:hypothetical protein
MLVGYHSPFNWPGMIHARLLKQKIEQINMSASQQTVWLLITTTMHHGITAFSIFIQQQPLQTCHFIEKNRFFIRNAQLKKQ